MQLAANMLFLLNGALTSQRCLCAGTTLCAVHGAGHSDFVAIDYIVCAPTLFQQGAPQMVWIKSLRIATTRAEAVSQLASLRRTQDSTRHAVDDHLDWTEWAHRHNSETQTDRVGHEAMHERVPLYRSTEANGGEGVVQSRPRRL